MERWHTRQYQQWVQSQRWRNLRNWYIVEHPWCERCQQNGVINDAEVVHHIRPVESVPGDAAREQLMFNPNNLKSLCKQCHVEVHIALRSSSPQVRHARNVAATADSVDQFFGEEQTPIDTHGCTTRYDEIVSECNRLARQRARNRKRASR